MSAGEYVPRPGDLFLTQIPGLTGAVIRFGQAVIAGDPSRYTHVGVVLDNGEVLAAQPHGARVDPIETILDDRPLAYLPVPDWADDRRDLIVNIARKYEGHRYGFWSYLWIGIARLGVRPSWLKRLVASEDWLICSALGDRAWFYAGIHLFNDGRLIGEVTPGDVAHVGTVHHAWTGPYPTMEGADRAGQVDSPP
jgi:hypothetical protein